MSGMGDPPMITTGKLPVSQVHNDLFNLSTYFALPYRTASLVAATLRAAATSSG